MLKPYYQKENITIYHGDCLEIMPQLDMKFDAIIADLPYGTVGDKIIPFKELWINYKKLIKNNGCIALFCKQPFTTKLGASNLPWLRYEWIVKKSSGGEFLNANRKPLPRHENILIFYKKLPTYNPQMSYGNPYSATSGGIGVVTQDTGVIGWITENDGQRYPTSVLNFSFDKGLHPTQKPQDLLEYLIRTYTNEGDIILDNTMGSGTTLVAAKATKRKAVGIEIGEEWSEVAAKRLEGYTPKEIKNNIDITNKRLF